MRFAGQMMSAYSRSMGSAERAGSGVVRDDASHAPSEHALVARVQNCLKGRSFVRSEHTDVHATRHRIRAVAAPVASEAIVPKITSVRTGSFGLERTGILVSFGSRLASTTRGCG
jgi:hypothetical protein